jgi:hypothetical protein
MANVLMLNLLIALLGNVYEDLVERVDGEQRAVIISYYNRWFWNDNYGFLITMPSPITYIVLLLSPLILFSKETRKWNSRLSKGIYPVQGVLFFIYFLAVSLMYWPLLYFKGFLIYGKTGKV